MNDIQDNGISVKPFFLFNLRYMHAHVSKQSQIYIQKLSQS